MIAFALFAAVWLAQREHRTGIEAEQLGAIFGLFVTSKAGGMGMGLSVSRSIIGARDGTLWAENGPKGSAMFISCDQGFLKEISGS